MASSTQNLSPATCNKTQNKKITGNRGGGNYSASHLLPVTRFTVIQKLKEKIPKCFRPSKSLSPHHNFQLLSILFFVILMDTAGFACSSLNIFHDRDTSAPPVLVSRIQCHKKCYFFCGIGILCTAAWADVAGACPVMEYV